MTLADLADLLQQLQVLGEPGLLKIFATTAPRVVRECPDAEPRQPPLKQSGDKLGEDRRGPKAAGDDSQPRA